jgi:formiminotetrahydrofolate cyclodeaminase
VAEKAAEVTRIANQLKPITNPNMNSDLTTAVALAGAGLEGALANVTINLRSINPDSTKPCSPEDQVFVDQIQKRVAVLKGQA